MNCANLNFKKLCTLEDETFTFPKINSNSELGNEEIYTVRIYKLLSNSLGNISREDGLQYSGRGFG